MLNRQDKSDYYRKVYEATGKDVFKVLTKEDISVVLNLTGKDQKLFVEDPNCRFCIIRTE